MKIGTRLRLGFALVLLLLVIVAMLGLRHMAAMQERIEGITRINNAKTQLASVMRDTVFERMIALRNMALIGSMSYMQPEADHIRTQAMRYRDAERRLTGMLRRDSGASRQELAVLDIIHRHEAVAQRWISRTVELALSAEADQIYGLLINDLLPAQTGWMAALDQLIAVEQAQNSLAAEDALRAYVDARNLMLGFGAAAVLTGLLVSFVLTRSLLRQLGGEPAYAAGIAGQIAAGDLTGDIDIHSRYRASLLFAMKTMRQDLSGLVRKVRANADKIAEASAGTAANSGELSNSITESKGALEETAAGLEQLTGIVKGNADNAVRGSELSASASEVVQQGGRAVLQVVHSMDAIRTSAMRISDIIGVIDGIAFRTKILALNAAVEAAHAGEQGRGFAVVAAEVGDLAERSAIAAKEIKALIGESVEQVSTGRMLAGLAGTTMGDVHISVKRLTDIVVEIAAASGAQSIGIDQVNLSLARMSQINRRNVALVDHVSSAAHAMQAHADDLAAAVGVFRLDVDTMGRLGQDRQMLL